MASLPLIGRLNELFPFYKMTPRISNTLSSLLLPLTFIASPGLYACQVCEVLPMHEVLVEELNHSQDAVLAVEITNEEDNYEIVEVLKTNSNLKSRTKVSASLPLFSGDAGKISHQTVLLTREGDNGNWVIRAPAEQAQQVDLFKKILLLPKDDDDARAAFFVKYLHHDEPLLAKVAATEMSNLPYASLHHVKTELNLAKIREYLNIAGDDGHRAFFYTLLGLCGENEDAELVEEIVQTMWRSHSAGNLSAVLAAYLEFKGDEAVKNIENLYFKDDQRTLTEIVEAVTALRLHGDTVMPSPKVNQEDVLAAYRVFLTERERLLGLVIEDLIRWQKWEFKEIVTSLSKWDEYDVGTKKLIQDYLVLCK